MFKNILNYKLLFYFKCLRFYTFVVLFVLTLTQIIIFTNIQLHLMVMHVRLPWSFIIVSDFTFCCGTKSQIDDIIIFRILNIETIIILIIS